MACIKLNPYWIAQLQTWPESGAGYHKVDVYLKNRIILKSVSIHNCEEFETIFDISNYDIIKISLIQ